MIGYIYNSVFSSVGDEGCWDGRGYSDASGHGRGCENGSGYGDARGSWFGYGCGFGAGSLCDRGYIVSSGCTYGTGYGDGDGCWDGTGNGGGNWYNERWRHGLFRI